MKATRSEPTVYSSEDDAGTAARLYNQVTVNNARELRVVVEGPEDGTWWNFSLSEAIDCGFSYSWEA